MIILINNKNTKLCQIMHCVLKDLFVKEKWFLFSASLCISYNLVYLILACVDNFADIVDGRAC